MVINSSAKGYFYRKRWHFWDSEMILKAILLSSQCFETSDCILAASSHHLQESFVLPFAEFWDEFEFVFLRVKALCCYISNMCSPRWIAHKPCEAVLTQQQSSHNAECFKFHENRWCTYHRAWLAQGCSLFPLSLLPLSFFHFPATALLGKRQPGKGERGAQTEGSGLERKKCS